MAETETTEDGGEDTPKKSSKMPLIIGLVLAIAGGGGGFYAASSGMILGGDAHAEEDAHDEEEMHSEAMPNVAFVAVDPLLISLSGRSENQHLRFQAQLEVPLKHQADVEMLLPRVVDVLNSYLRALETADLTDPSALVRLRAQMLRRVQIVTGEGRVNDLLIMEFVVN